MKSLVLEHATNLWLCHTEKLDKEMQPNIVTAARENSKDEKQN